MLEIISEVVSARNGESGAHMRHLCLLTEVLLDTLVSKTKRYTLTPHERKVIVTASAFHDIGKMGIDEKILNKSGQLTEEEYIVMKSHTLIGASMLARLATTETRNWRARRTRFAAGITSATMAAATPTA